MNAVTIQVDAETLSRLLVRVAAGEEIVLARGTEPAAKLVPYRAQKARRRFGAYKGLVVVDRAFFEPLPVAELGQTDSRP